MFTVTKAFAQFYPTGAKEVYLSFALLARVKQGLRKVSSAMTITREMVENSDNDACAHYVLGTLLQSIDQFLKGAGVEDRTLDPLVTIRMDAVYARDINDPDNYELVAVGKIETILDTLKNNPRAAIDALLQAEKGNEG
jgi:hypothetical protein